MFSFCERSRVVWFIHLLIRINGVQILAVSPANAQQVDISSSDVTAVRICSADRLQDFWKHLLDLLFIFLIYSHQRYFIISSTKCNQFNFPSWRLRVRSFGNTTAIIDIQIAHVQSYRESCSQIYFMVMKRNKNNLGQKYKKKCLRKKKKQVSKEIKNRCWIFLINTYPQAVNSDYYLRLSWQRTQFH